MATLSAEDLRTIPSLTGTAPRLELDDLPRDPTDLFAEWLRVALEHGVPEPVAATLATVDDDGVPDARTLILKAVDARGWAFAGSATSRKGQQLTACPSAALNLWWQPLVRAVRVRGRVVEASPEDSAADFAARSDSARATRPRAVECSSTPHGLGTGATACPDCAATASTSPGTAPAGPRMAAARTTTASSARGWPRRSAA